MLVTKSFDFFFLLFQVTLCPGTIGWKDVEIPNSTNGVFRMMCGDQICEDEICEDEARSREDFVACVENKTFGPEESVRNAFRGFGVPAADLTELR